jgi:pimeloyl-ACP methyl ester carboxylesterase
MLVLLHEGLGSVSMWKDFPDMLAEKTGHGVLAYSRYGHGGSSELGEPRRVDYMHHEALADLPQILAGLDIERPVLIGHSDGASIAIIHAGGGYEVAGLVLLAPHVFVEDVTINNITAARRGFETTGIADKLARYHDHPRSMFFGWNDIWLQPEFRDWNIEAYIRDIRAPLLLMQSRDDPYGTLAQIDAITRRASAPVEKLLFAGRSHSPHVDCTEQTIDAIKRFVNSLDVS